MLFVDAEKPERRGGEQPIDGNLNVCAHMPRKLPRRRDQLIARNAGEMPVQRVAGMAELLGASGFGKVVRDLAGAIVADQRRHASEREPVVVRKRAAEFAFVVRHFTARCNRLARDDEPMTRSIDALSGGLEHLGGNVARMGPANCVPVFFDRIDELDCVGIGPLQHQAQKLKDEILRCVIVVAKDDPEEIGLALNIPHGVALPDEPSFGGYSRSWRLEQKKNIVTTPTSAKYQKAGRQ